MTLTPGPHEGSCPCYRSCFNKPNLSSKIDLTGWNGKPLSESPTAFESAIFLRCAGREGAGVDFGSPREVDLLRDTRCQ
jgi:hypothetical protein